MKQLITIKWKNSLHFNKFFILKYHVVFYISKVVIKINLEVKSIWTSVVLRVGLNVAIHLGILKRVTFCKIYSSEVRLTIICWAYWNFLKVSFEVTFLKTLARAFLVGDRVFMELSSFPPPQILGTRNLSFLEVLYIVWAAAIDNAFLKVWTEP